MAVVFPLNTPVTINGKTMGTYLFAEAYTIDKANIEIAEQYARERLFEANGFVRVRDDGKDAKLEDQWTDKAFHDFKYIPWCDEFHGVWFEIEQYKTEEGKANYTRRCKIFCHEDPKLIEEAFNEYMKALNAARPKTAAAVTTATIKAEKEDFKAKKDKITPIVKEQPATTEKPAETTEEKKDKQPPKYLIQAPDYNYFIQDRVTQEPFKSNPVLVQQLNKLEEANPEIKINAYYDNVGLIWCPVFEVTKDENQATQYKFNEGKSFILDLNGLLINKDPKVYMMKMFRRYGDECRFHTLLENTLDTVVKEGKLPTIAKERLEKMDYLIIMNKVVDLASIMKANVPEPVIEKICKDMVSDSRTKEIVDLYGMNGNIRLRFKECSVDGNRYVLCIDQNSTNSILAAPIGPSCPGIDYIFETGKEVRVEMQLPATA